MADLVSSLYLGLGIQRIIAGRRISAMGGCSDLYIFIVDCMWRWGLWKLFIFFTTRQLSRARTERIESSDYSLARVGRGIKSWYCNAVPRTRTQPNCFSYSAIKYDSSQLLLS